MFIFMLTLALQAAGCCRSAEEDRNADVPGAPARERNGATVKNQSGKSESPMIETPSEVKRLAGELAELTRRKKAAEEAARAGDSEIARLYDQMREARLAYERAVANDEIVRRLAIEQDAVQDRIRSALAQAESGRKETP